jgi:alkylation response protein AidB-like acyl-CoA dehydrogenase
MEQGMAAEFLANPHACFGGSGAATGVAEETGGGYRISGFWKYATGAPHLSAFTANCRLRRNGADISDEKGAPAIRAFVFHADEVRVHHDWQTMGLRATAGHAFEVKDLWVPASRAFDIMPEAATLPDPIFQYPFLPFAEATLAVNSAGMAWHFLDACAAIFETKAARNGHRDFYEGLLRQAEESFGEQRMAFYRVADASWEECVKRGYCRAETLNDLSRESRALAHCARGLATKLFPYCGMTAIRPETEINRVWRDLFTASQHSLLNPAG